MIKFEHLHQNQTLVPPFTLRLIKFNADLNHKKKFTDTVFETKSCISTGNTASNDALEKITVH